MLAHGSSLKTHKYERQLAEKHHSTLDGGRWMFNVHFEANKKMLHAIKHISIRLWLTILLGGLIALLILPVLQKPVGLEWVFALALPVFVVIYFVIGWIFNTTGRQIVRRLVTEADVWERSGNDRQAEKLLHKAVSVCDSFLVSPFKKADRTRGLTGHMARFYLTRSDISPRAQRIIQAYLKIRPQDQDVAEAWVQYLTRQDTFRKEQETLLYRIERAQSNRPDIQAAIAQLYLNAGRADFEALQTYRRLVESKQKIGKSVLIRMAELLLQHKRIDAWAVRVYLAAHRLNPKHRQYISGMAACLHWAPEVDTGSAVFNKVRALLADFDETTIEKMRTSFKPVKKATSQPQKNRYQLLAGTLLPLWRASANSIVVIPARLHSAVSALFQRMRGYPNFKPLLRWTVVSLVGIGLAVFVVNTARHLLQTRSTPEEIETPQVVEITDPFTLQVAAYLKNEHAEKYVQHLKTQGLDAYWTVAQGATRKWYQVRVSHFPDKDSARAYGEDLKAKGIIDDFYVANYQRP